ncbi:FYN-binding protein 2 [Sorex fumeus]|uniref:FYN-binding protein 2 n=1 Tax=Sorex fumeus TaxID=62283 RepID=UPI0024AD86CD|nr:FYN-binding protein 2 [Sorex fumeus]
MDLTYFMDCLGKGIDFELQGEAQRSEIKKCSNSPGPPEVSTPAVNAPFDMNGPSAEKAAMKKAMAANSFQDKLWNWEMASSQKSEAPPTFLPYNNRRRAFHLEVQENRRLSAEKPRGSLQVPQAKTLPSRRKEKLLTSSSEGLALLPSLHDKQTLEEPSPEKCTGESTNQPVYDSELTSQAPEKQLEDRKHQLPRTRPLPSVESLGPPPAKPTKPPSVKLRIFQSQPAAVPLSPGEYTLFSVTFSLSILFSAECEEPHNYEATISYPRHSGNSINLCTAKEITDCFHFSYGSPHHEDTDKRMKEKESHELEPQKMEKDPHFSYFSKVGAWGKMHVTQVHRSNRNKLNRQQDAVADIIIPKTLPKDFQLTMHPEGHCGYVEALELKCETPGQVFFRTKSPLEEMYDDVECPSRKGQKSDLSNTSASDSEENGREMYEDVYKTKSNYPKIDLDGKEALKRLQRFFKKEKDKLKMKSKSKGKMSSFSVSMPDLGIRTQEVTIYDDVDINEKESKDDDKQKTWKPKFLMAKEKKENKGAEVTESLSPRNFFKIKKQNFKKNKMEKEEKIFRERFEYNKEITVINTAVASSSNSRNGIFDLPITPGEELEVIDITEENLVICRNSKGRYGYVLIEHLDFKHQGWAP